MIEIHKTEGVMKAKTKMRGRYLVVFFSDGFECEYRKDRSLNSFDTHTITKEEAINDAIRFRHYLNSVPARSAQ